MLEYLGIWHNKYSHSTMARIPYGYAHKYVSKGQEISEDFFCLPNTTKNQRKTFHISALASKSWLIKKIKALIILVRGRLTYQLLFRG